MHKEIKWHIDRQFPEGIIKKIESLWNVKFPYKYVNIVTQHDGALPKVKTENGEWKSGIVNIPKWRGKYAGFSFLRYTNSDILERTMVVFTYNAFKECLPEPNKIFPFADDGGGNLFFFDYRKNANEPAIVFLDHEIATAEKDLAEEDLAKKPVIEWLNDNLYPVSNSFSELLDSIYPYTDL